MSAAGETTVTWQSSTNPAVTSYRVRCYSGSPTAQVANSNAFSSTFTTVQATSPLTVTRSALVPNANAWEHCVVEAVAGTTVVERSSSVKLLPTEHYN